MVTGRQLAELPPFGRRHDGRAHEATEARAVGSEDHGHVAGEVDGTEGVAGVVDVRRVQAGLAAVRPCPVGPRTDEADAGAIRVEVHGPVDAEEGVEPCRRQEVGGGVGPEQHPDLPR